MADSWRPATISSVLEEQLAEIGKEFGINELIMGADYWRAQIEQAWRDQVPDALLISLPSMSNPPSPLELSLDSAMQVLRAWAYSEEHPESAEAGWSAEYYEDEFRQRVVEWLRSLGYFVSDERHIGGELAAALEAVELGDDREYGWALDLAEVVREFLEDRGYEGLPPVGPGLRTAWRAHDAPPPRADFTLKRIADSVDEIAEEGR